MSSVAPGNVRLEASWPMTETDGPTAADLVSGNDLVCADEPSRVEGPFGASSALRCAGRSTWATSRGVLQTDQSFSVAAWVRLDSGLTGADLTMDTDWFAWTAVAQSGSYHSPFYLGARQIEYGGEGTGDYHLHWNFTVAPVDGSDDGPVDWIHAHSSQELRGDQADQWVLLVGVYDLETEVARIFVPTQDDHCEQPLPSGWPLWQGGENVQIGQAWFRDEFVDKWPGDVGPVRFYSGVLDEEGARQILAEAQHRTEG